MESSQDGERPPGAPRLVADGLGACDVLVFRRVGRWRWTHLGGYGRGAGWAGTIELAGSPERGLDAVLAGSRPLRRHGQKPHHVIGPYWAATSAVVRVDRDHAVVLGAPQPTLRLIEADDALLAAVAARAAEAVTAVSPAKHLADELEILNALKELTLGAPATLDGLLEHLARCAAESLSCDLAAVWLPDGRRAVADPGWRPQGGPLGAAEAAHQLAGGLGRDPHGPDRFLVQDASERPLPPPVGRDPQVASYLAVPLDVGGRRGCLLAVHSTSRPRGFTALCEELAVQLARTGAPLIEQALTREELVRQLNSSREHALVDPLTGAANRRGWDEAVARARLYVAAGGAVTVVTVDLDDLKQVNDTHGHGAGDELIIDCAQALRSRVRGQPDIIARIGGDEFALLLRGHELDPDGIADRLRRSLEAVTTGSGLPLRTSVGAATCEPRGSLDDAIKEADAAMYEDKRTRRDGG